MGGTLDISTFYLPLRHLGPCTFNAALNMRTNVRLSSYDHGKIKITSRGFDDLVVDSDKAPFDHPMGLMLAVAAYFHADGVWIDIESTSPPRSALGGSSVAAVALVWAFAKAAARSGRAMPRRGDAALLAHAIEQSVACVPCGLQDQLAAAYGGINGWFWQPDPGACLFSQQKMDVNKDDGDFSRNILVAYCGEPHFSSNINGIWVRDFIGGSTRGVWEQIARCSRRFMEALAQGDIGKAKLEMDQDVDLRSQLTPDVLDPIGWRLVDAARMQSCGARFTGAGGGGCIWALGTADQIRGLKRVWRDLLSGHPAATLLNSEIDVDGVL
jgi:D-glycero-alpha-D-manno-heptose-7-phosphate kinase